MRQKADVGNSLYCSLCVTVQGRSGLYYGHNNVFGVLVLYDDVGWRWWEKRRRCFATRASARFACLASFRQLRAQMKKRDTVSFSVQLWKFKM
jgi:hypothetical protein